MSAHLTASGRAAWCIAALAGAASAQAPAREVVAITPSSASDVVSGNRLPDRTVVIRDGRIVSVDRAAPAPRDARVLDGRGKFLIPGLWDMHMHLDVGGIGTN